MAIADDRQAARAGLQMISPAPFNAEAPPEALAGEITPTQLHYVRSNFAVPAHEGILEVGGAVENPTTLTLDDLRAMPRHERDSVEHVRDPQAPPGELKPRAAGGEQIQRQDRSPDVEPTGPELRGSQEARREHRQE